MGTAGPCWRRARLDRHGDMVITGTLVVVATALTIGLRRTSRDSLTTASSWTQLRDKAFNVRPRFEVVAATRAAEPALSEVW